jgi:hypothetical protein
VASILRDPNHDPTYLLFVAFEFTHIQDVKTNSWPSEIAARAALKRKKQHEHTLEQTSAQIATLEQQIYSIEAANINRETLAAMERAGEAMKQIHGKLNIDKVDETMYVLVLVHRDAEWIALTVYFQG